MLDLIQRGGWALWVIVGCSILSLGVTLERWLVMRRTNVDARALMGRISAALAAGDVAGGIAACDATGGPLAETLGAGLRKMMFLEEIGKPSDEVERGIIEAMEGHATVAVDALEQNLTTLATIASLAPILGMLGTVFGMIRAFGSIEGTGSLTPEAVAGGISEALLCTAGGLIVAAVSTVEYNYFMARVNRFVVQVQAAGLLVERIVRARTHAPVPHARAGTTAMGTIGVTGATGGAAATGATSHVRPETLAVAR